MNITEFNVKFPHIELFLSLDCLCKIVCCLVRIVLLYWIRIIQNASNDFVIFVPKEEEICVHCDEQVQGWIFGMLFILTV
jgi:hypothetical protein